MRPTTARSSRSLEADPWRRCSCPSVATSGTARGRTVAWPCLTTEFVLVCNPDRWSNRAARTRLVDALVADPPRVAPSVRCSASRPTVALSLRAAHPDARRCRGSRAGRPLPAAESLERPVPGDDIDPTRPGRRRLDLRCSLRGPLRRVRERRGFRRGVLHVRRGPRPVLAPAPAGWRSATSLRRGDPRPGALDRPPAYRMLFEHHRSTLRFASRRASGWRRIGLVPVALVLGARLVMAMVQTALSGSSRRHGASAGAD